MKGGSTIIVDVYLEQINENTFEPTNNLLLFILHEINIQSMTKFVTKKDYKSSKTTDNNKGNSSCNTSCTLWLSKVDKNIVLWLYNNDDYNT